MQSSSLALVQGSMDSVVQNSGSTITVQNSQYHEKDEPYLPYFTRLGVPRPTRRTTADTFNHEFSASRFTTSILRPHVLLISYSNSTILYTCCGHPSTLFPATIHKLLPTAAYTHLPTIAHWDHRQLLWVFLPHPQGICSLETQDVLHLPPHTPLHSRRASLWTKQNICLQKIQDKYIFLDNYNLIYTIAEVKYK